MLWDFSKSKQTYNKKSSVACAAAAALLHQRLQSTAAPFQTIAAKLHKEITPRRVAQITLPLLSLRQIKPLIVHN